MHFQKRFIDQMKECHLADSPVVLQTTSEFITDKYMQCSTDIF